MSRIDRIPTVEQLQRAVFRMPGSQLAATVSQILTRAQLKAIRSKNPRYDCELEDTGYAGESKFARAAVEDLTLARYTPGGLIAAYGSEQCSTFLSYDEAYDGRYFHAGYHDLKRQHFKIFHYGIYFTDRIIVFCAEVAEIKNFPHMSTSRLDSAEQPVTNSFSIGPTTLHYHIENHIFDQLSYRELHNILFSKGSHNEDSLDRSKRFRRKRVYSSCVGANQSQNQSSGATHEHIAADTAPTPTLACTECN